MTRAIDTLVPCICLESDLLAVSDAYVCPVCHRVLTSLEFDDRHAEYLAEAAQEFNDRHRWAA